MKRLITLFLSVLFLLNFNIIADCVTVDSSMRHTESALGNGLSELTGVAQELPEMTSEELEKIYNEDNYENEFVPGEVLVGMKTTVANSRYTTNEFPGLEVIEVDKLYESIVASLPEEAIHEPALKAVENLRAVYTIKLASKTRESVLQAIEILKKNPNVAYAEPNYISSPTITSNDYNNYDLWGMEKIQTPQAWNITTGSNSVRIGVLDTGFDYTHPDLADNINQSLAYYVSEGKYGDDANINESTDHGRYYGHGTHVSGIIGSVGNNDEGLVGVNWDVSIVPIKICNNEEDASTSMALVTEAVVYATALDLPIINMSYGISNSQSLINAVRAYNGLFIISAGNNSSNNDNNEAYRSLSAFDNVIFVGNSNNEDSKSTTSNFGESTVDLFASGSNIYSTIPVDSYGIKSGTSMAAPYVSGVAALLKSYRPYLTTKEIKTLILDNVDQVNGLIGECVTGGRLNAFKALSAAATYTNVYPNVVGDFNGDNKDEVAVLIHKTNNFLELKVGVSGAITQNISDFSRKWISTYGFAWDRIGERMVAGDFNGDGRDDIAFMYDHTIEGSNSTGAMTIFVLLSNGSSFDLNEWFSFDTGFPLSRVSNRMVSGDFNGDGKDDISVFYDSTVSGSGSTGAAELYTFISSGSNFSYQNWWSVTSGFPLSRVGNRMASGDFNGDGKDDISVFYDSTVSGSGSTGAAEVYTFMSSGSNFSYQNWWSIPSSFPLSRVGNRMASGDFNGDGKDDISVFYDSTVSGSGSTGAAVLYTFMSSGSNFSYQNWWSIESGYPLNRVANRISSGDFDNNGKDDIAAIYFENVFRLHTFKSDGSNFIYYGP